MVAGRPHLLHLPSQDADHLVGAHLDHEGVADGDEEGDSVVAEQGARLLFASAHGLEDFEVIPEPKLHVLIVHLLNGRRALLRDRPELPRSAVSDR